jgi:hypothetical protein
MAWITRTDKPLSDPTGLSSMEAVSTVLDTRVSPSPISPYRPLDSTVLGLVLPYTLRSCGVRGQN